MSTQSPRITFRIERDVVLEPLWFDQQWYDELRAEGLSHEEALRQQVEIGIQEDPLSLFWEAFGEFASEFASSITNLDLVN